MTQAARILAQAEARLDLGQRFRIARGRAQRALARLKAFDEGQHPRDEHGRWTDAGGSAPEQSAAFKKWFGNSKVVDGNGNPLIVYHGTFGDFTAFQLPQNDIGLHFGSARVASDRLAYLAQLNPDKGDAHIVPVFLKIENPIRMDDSGAGDALNLNYELRELFPDDSKRIDKLNTYEKIRRFIQSKGFDGIVYRNPGENGESDNSDSYVVFEPTQIKSAIGNSGKFDPSDPDITKYDPSEPRDPAGKWTDGGGAPADIAPDIPARGMSEKYVRAAIEKVSKDLDYDPATINIETGAPKTFELNGRQYQAAGLAHTSQIGKFVKVITIYSQNTNGGSVDGLICHEIEHIKFETAINRYEAERKAVINEAPSEGGIDQVMRPNGSLKPPYDKKYPVYTAMHEAYYQHGILDFAQADGVTEYSFDWWLNWKDGKTDRLQNARIAVHETLAEMARVKYETGKFPDHMGERILRWRGEDKPKPSQAQMDKNAKLWRDLYRAVEKVWKLPT